MKGVLKNVVEDIMGFFYDKIGVLDGIVENVWVLG